MDSAGIQRVGAVADAQETGCLPLFDDLLAAKPAILRLNEQVELALHPGGGPE